MLSNVTARERVRAFAGGVTGALAMMASAKVLGSPVMRDLERLSGTMLFEPRTPASRVAGATIQLVNGGLLAQGYLEATDRLPSLKPRWQDGLAIGVIHGIAAGLLLGVVPAVHPRVPDEVPKPGSFLSRRGRHGPAMLIALHALFGAVVGAAISKPSATPALRSRGSISPISYTGANDERR